MRWRDRGPKEVKLWHLFGVMVICLSPWFIGATDVWNLVDNVVPGTALVSDLDTITTFTRRGTAERGASEVYWLDSEVPLEVGFEASGRHRQGSARAFVVNSASCAAQAALSTPDAGGNSNFDNGRICFDITAGEEQICYSVQNGVYPPGLGTWTCFPIGLNALPDNLVFLWEDGACPANTTDITGAATCSGGGNCYQGAHIMGADLGGIDVGIPDIEGETCPGGAGCGGLSNSSYDNQLDLDELPMLSSDFVIAGALATIRTTPIGLGPASSEYPGDVPPFTGETTSGLHPHYHTIRTVRLCKKDA